MRNSDTAHGIDILIPLDVRQGSVLSALKHYQTLRRVLEGGVAEATTPSAPPLHRLQRLFRHLPMHLVSIIGGFEGAVVGHCCDSDVLLGNIRDSELRRTEQLTEHVYYTLVVPIGDILGVLND